MLKIFLTFLSTIISKIIGEHLKHLSFHIIAAFIVGMITYITNPIYLFFQQHMFIFLFLFWFTVSITLERFFKLIVKAINSIQPINSTKKIVNSIAVDQHGDCFCPACDKALLIIRHPQYVGTKTFHCTSCKNLLSVILDNGKHAWPYYFANHQKLHPQSTLTAKQFSEHVQQSYKDAGST
ncbi:MAG: hypothetical protein ACYC0J_09495 [Gammaproteobacteria bacterium]